VIIEQASFAALQSILLAIIFPLFRSHLSTIPWGVISCHWSHVTDCFCVKARLEVKQVLCMPFTDPEGFRRLRFPDFETVGT
jgi:hypothetical protein